jgi:hypothetical protein
MKQVFDDSESPAAEGATTPSPAVAARGPAADKLRPVASGQRGRPDTGPPKPPQRGRFWPPRVNVRVHTFDSLRYREFRLLWLGSLSSSGSLWVQQLIVGWLTYDLTRSPLITSLALGLGALPFPPGAPIGGVLADIWDRRKLLMAAWATQAAITAGFSVVVLLDRVET